MIPVVDRSLRSQSILPFTPSATVQAMALVALTFVAYIPALRAGWVWDDFSITDNPFLRSAEGLRQIWTKPWLNVNEAHYWPLVYTGFWVERHFWGARPMGYHAVNVALHLLNSLLVWKILTELRIRGAWLATAIFALHPVHAESVAWAIERKDLQSALFYLLAFLTFLKFERWNHWRWYPLSLVLFLCALLSKSSAVGFPLAVLLTVWITRNGTKATYLAVVPFFIVAAVMGIADAIYSHRHEGMDPIPLTVLERIEVVGRGAWFYVLKCLWPGNQMATYPKWDTEGMKAWGIIFPSGVIVALVGLTLGSGKKVGGALGLALFFLLSVGPTLGLVDYGYMKVAYVADRYAYLAVAGWAVLAGCGAVMTAEKLWRGSRKIGSKIVICGAGSALLAMGVLTCRQAETYHDARTLWTHNLKKNPKSWLAHNNLGVALAEAGEPDYESARQHFLEAVRLNPHYAEAYTNLGNSLLQQGKIEEAIGQFGRAIQVNAQYADAHFNLGLALERTGDIENAATSYRRTVRLKPDQVEAWFNLGGALRRMGKLDEAAEALTEAVKLRPDWEEPEYMLGLTLMEERKLPDAISHFHSALKIKPDYADAFIKLGDALAVSGKTDEAIENYQQALRIKPGMADAHFNMGNFELQRGLLEQAIRHYRDALQIRPDYPEALNNMGIALAREGKFEEAVEQFEKALQLQPDFPNARDNLERARKAPERQRNEGK